MRLFLTLFLGLAAALGVHPQSASKVIKAAERALGGQKALIAIRSSYRTGTITRLEDGSTGKFLQQSAEPGLLNISYDIAGFEYESGYNGRSGWTRDSRNGLQTLTGPHSSQMQLRAAYRSHLWLQTKEEKSKLVLAGQANIDGKLANGVTLTNPKGVTVRSYFDVVTGLPVHDEIGEETIDYSDYRPVNGIQQPYAMTLKNSEGVYLIKLDTINLAQTIAKSEFDFPQVFGEPLPDIASLLKELQSNEDRVDELLEKYTYTETATERGFDNSGRLVDRETTVKEISFYKGYRIEREVERNGRKLSQSDQEKEDRDATKRVEEIEKKVAKQDADRMKGDQPSNEERRISIAEVLRASRLINPRRERFRGRDVIVFDFEPNPDFDYKNAKSLLKFFGKTAGVMWIDEEDKQVARVEAVLAQSLNIGGGILAKLKKGATFTLEKERVGDEIWLPSLAEINLAVRVLLVKGIDVNQLIRYSNYKRFSTEVKDASVDEKKP